MSSALEAVQDSLVTALHNDQDLMDVVSGIYDGPPPRAAFPYVAFTTGASRDWSHKTGVGRVLSMALAVHDETGRADRLRRVMGLIETALEGGPADPPEWQIVTFAFHRTRIFRNPSGPWSGLVEFRARCLRK